MSSKYWMQVICEKVEESNMIGIAVQVIYTDY